MQAIKLVFCCLFFCAAMVVHAQMPSLVLQKGHFGQINSISFSSNDREVITTGDDGSIKIWDAFSQRITGELDARGASIVNAYYSANGKYIVAQFSRAANGYDGFDNYANFNVWNRATGLLQYNFSRQDVKTMPYDYPMAYSGRQGANSISPGGDWVIQHQPPNVEETQDGNAHITRQQPIGIYATASGKLFRSVNRFADVVDAPSFVGFISDSCLLVTQYVTGAGGKDFITRFHVYNFLEDREQLVFADTSQYKTKSNIVVSPNGQYLVRFVTVPPGRSDEGITEYTDIWSIPGGRPVWRQPITLTDAVFSNNGNTVALCYFTDKERSESNSQIHQAAFARVMTVELDSGQAWRLSANNVFVANPAISADGSYLAAAVFSGKAYDENSIRIDTGFSVKIYDASSGKLHSVSHLDNTPTAVAFNRDGRYLVTGFDNGDFSIWENAASGAPEIAAVKNEMAPLIDMHIDQATNKIFYTTSNMFGVQPAQSSNKISSISTDSARISKQYFFLNDRYSLLNMTVWHGQYISREDKLVLVNNENLSVVKEFPYRFTADPFKMVRTFATRGSMPGNGYMLTTSLNDPELQSFSVYAKKAEGAPGYIPGAELGVMFAIIKSRYAADTILLFSNFGELIFNKKRKGYVFQNAGNYFMDARNTNVKQITNRVKLASPILSGDGNWLLGRAPGKAFINNAEPGTLMHDPLINNSHLLYGVDLNNTFKFRTPIVFEKDSVGELGQLIIAPNGKTACILMEPTAPAAYFVRVFNMGNGKPMYNLHLANSGSVTGAVYTKDSRYLFTWSASGLAVKWDLSTGKQVYTMVFFQDHDYAIILPEGYYYISSRTDARLLNFKLGNKLYNFSQFDLQLNRPDKVLQAIGSTDKNLMDEYYKAWQGRVKKSGFTTETVNKTQLAVPQVNILADSLPVITHNNALWLSCALSDEKFSVTRYNIFVNDVPLNGINGRLLDHPARMARAEQRVLLNEGLNKIEVNCSNENGNESSRETIYIRYVPDTPIVSKTYFIGIGINRYSAHSSFVDLSYCVKDIRDLSAAFQEKYKDALVIDTLMNETASKENILALKQKLLQTSVHDKVIVSFSGHGMVDPGHPGDFYFATGTTYVNNPAENGISYTQLEELLDSIPARKKLLLLDACHSGEADDNATTQTDHIPGTKRGIEDNSNKAGSIEILDVVENSGPKTASSTDIFKLMKEAFVDIRRNNGAYVLSAAQSNESAGEGGGITNGWFSSCLIEQLKSNKNMTVNELSQKVNQCVSAKSSGNQNTDNRQELAEVNWQLW